MPGLKRVVAVRYPKGRPSKKAIKNAIQGLLGTLPSKNSIQKCHPKLHHPKMHLPPQKCWPSGRVSEKKDAVRVCRWSSKSVSMMCRCRCVCVELLGGCDGYSAQQRTLRCRAGVCVSVSVSVSVSRELLGGCDGYSAQQQRTRSSTKTLPPKTRRWRLGGGDLGPRERWLGRRRRGGRGGGDDGDDRHGRGGGGGGRGRVQRECRRLQ